MNPGTLDRKIQIQRLLEGLPLVTATGELITTATGVQIITGDNQDDLGQEVEAWGLWKYAWARKIEAKGSETLANQRESGQQPVVFRVRYRSDILTSDRIVCDGRAYDIESQVEIGRRAMLDLFCTVHLTTETVV